MTVYEDPAVQLLQGDVMDQLKALPDGIAQTCVTSPPYYNLRDYGVEGQIGLEPTFDEWLEKLVAVFREVRRVLKDDGTAWINVGDGYATGTNADRKPTTTEGDQVPASWSNRSQTMRRHTVGLKPKDLIGQPWALAFALRADGWYLRSDIIWSKPNPMPESVTDRPTKAHEYIFLLSKSERYFYDSEAIKEPCITADEAVWDPGTDGLGGADRKTGKTTRRFAKRPAGWNDGATEDDKVGRYRSLGEKGEQADETKVRSSAGSRMGRGAGWRNDPSNFFLTRNKRTVWNVGTESYQGAHFATFPEKLIEPCILAGAPAGGIVLEPFAGSGTTLSVAKRLGRKAIGIELNPAYVELAKRRISVTTASLF